jgi:regulator of sigma E protease
MNVLFPVLLYFSVFAGTSRFYPPTIGVVLPGHPAEGKLLPGDRVVAVDGERISMFDQLARAVEVSPGKELKLTVFRGNELRRRHGDPRRAKRIKKPLGIVDVVGEIGVTPSRPAPVVGVSRPDSPAYRAGLRTFDLVTEVRGQAPCARGTTSSSRCATTTARPCRSRTCGP